MEPPWPQLPISHEKASISHSLRALYGKMLRSVRGWSVRCGSVLPPSVHSDLLFQALECKPVIFQVLATTGGSVWLILGFGMKKLTVPAD